MTVNWFTVARIFALLTVAIWTAAAAQILGKILIDIDREPRGALGLHFAGG
jgi:hypothetical protein